MPKMIKVTGYLEVEDSEYDDGPMGPLTEEAYNIYTGAESSMTPRPVPNLTALEDITFEEDDR